MGNDEHLMPVGFCACEQPDWRQMRYIVRCDNCNRMQRPNREARREAERNMTRLARKAARRAPR